MSNSEKRLKKQNTKLIFILILLLLAISVTLIGTRYDSSAYAMSETDDTAVIAEETSEADAEAENFEQEQEQISVLPEAPAEDTEEIPEETAEEEMPEAVFPAGKYQGFYQCVNGRTLDYWLLVPQNCTAGMPLIVYLHNDRYLGWGNFEALGETSAMAANVLDEFGENFPAIILIPQAHYAEEGFIGAGVNDAVFGLINEVADEYLVDRSNISLTGSGRGATAVWYFIDTYGSFFSCAVPVSCGPNYTSGYGMACAGVPVLAYVGSGDDYDCYGADMQAACNSICSYGGKAVLQTVDSCDHFSAEYAVYTSTVINWLASGGDGIQAFQ